MADSSKSMSNLLPPKQRSYSSTMSIEKCTFKWTLENFNQKAGPVGATKSSPMFPEENQPEQCKWILTFYPYGENETKKEYICLKLTMKKGPGNEVPTEFQLRLKGSEDQELCYRQDDYKFKSDGVYTWEQLPKREHVKKALKDDILVIDLSIKCYVQEVNKYYEVEPPIPHLRMVHDYAELRKSGKLCDAVIHVDGSKFPVHSVILAARSPVFMAMFEHFTEEKKSNIISVKDIDNRTMIHLLDFMYSCEIPDFDVPKAIKLMKVADKYCVLDLREHCSNYLAMSMNTTNVVEILLLADMYSAKELKERAIDFICTNKARFSELDNLDNILEKDARVLIEILQKMSNTN